MGSQISPDGNIFTSPGLQKLIELKQDVDKLPTNFNFEKKILRSSVPKRIISDIGGQYSELADSLLPEYRDILLQAQLENRMLMENQDNPNGMIGLSSETKESLQKKLLQEKYEKKMRAILKRKSERELKRKEELLKEIQQKVKEQMKISTDPFENYQAQIQMPYIKEEDVEFWFENIYKEYSDEAISKIFLKYIFYKPCLNLLAEQQNSRTRNQPPKFSPYLSAMNATSQQRQRNPFKKDTSTSLISADQQWSPAQSSKHSSIMMNDKILRKNLMFDGGETPALLKFDLGLIKQTTSNGSNHHFEQEIISELENDYDEVGQEPEPDPEIQSQTN